MKTIICPNCKEYTFKLRTKSCLNTDCTLHNAIDAIKIESSPKTLSSVFWSIWYSTPKQIFRSLQNCLYKRPDLIRTGLDKTHHTDSDYKILYGMMKILEDFVLVEQGCELIDIDEYCLTNPTTDVIVKSLHDQNYYSNKILKLYIDWKVEYPRMLKELNVMLIDDTVSHDAYFAYEEKIRKYENNMLRRLINLRSFMWT